MPKEDNDTKKSYHWKHIKFKNKNGKGLQGISKFDNAFLEELNINKLNNTDLQLIVIREFCHNHRPPYEIIFMNNSGEENKTLYSPSKMKDN